MFDCKVLKAFSVHPSTCFTLKLKHRSGLSTGLDAATSAALIATGPVFSFLVSTGLLTYSTSLKGSLVSVSAT